MTGFRRILVFSAMCLALFASGAAVAVDGEPLVSVDFSGTPLDQAVAELFRQTSYAYEFGDPEVEQTAALQQVTIVVRSVSFPKALETVLSLAGLTYSKRDNRFVITTDTEGPRRLATLDLENVPVREALDQLFAGMSLTYDLPAEFADRRASLHADETMWCVALIETLDSAGLACTREDDVIRIVTAETGAELARRWRSGRDLESAMQPLGSGKQRIVYVAEYGDRDQLRVCVFPYPGYDALVWEGPGGSSISYLQLSPDFSQVLVASGVPYAYARQFSLVTVADGRKQDITEAGEPTWAFWRDENTVALLERHANDLQEYTYDCRTGRSTLTRSYQYDRSAKPEAELAFLSGPLADRIGVLEGMLADGDLAVPFTRKEAAGAVVRGAGIPYVPSWAISVMRPVAAVSPNGEDIALTTGHSADAVFVIWRHVLYRDVHASNVRRVIPLTELVSGETVWVSDLRWSEDGQRLLFTEVHFRPARTHVPDLGGDIPDPLDWTYVTRMYTLKSGEVETIVVGRDAFLAPDQPTSPKPVDKD